MSTKEEEDNNDRGGEEVNINIPPKPPRPYTAYHIFFQLERNFILQNDEKGKHLELPAEIDESASERPERYRGVVMQKNWFISGRVRKRKDHKIHGVISFTDLTKTVSRNWKAAGPEVRIYCHAFADKLLQRYQAEMAAYKEKYGNEAIAIQLKKRKQDSKTNTRRLEVLSQAKKHPLHWTIASSQPDAGASGSAVAALPVFANAWTASQPGPSGAQGSAVAPLPLPFARAAWASTSRTSQEATAQRNERSRASDADPPIIHFDTNPNTLNNSETLQYRPNPNSSRSQPTMNNLENLPSNQNPTVLNFGNSFRQGSSDSPKTNDHNHHSNTTNNLETQHSHPNWIINLHDAHLNSNLNTNPPSTNVARNASGRAGSSIHNYAANDNAASDSQTFHPPEAPPQFVTTSIHQNQYNPSNDNRQNLCVPQGPANLNQGQNDAVRMSFGMESCVPITGTNSSSYTNHTSNINQNPAPLFRNVTSSQNLPHENRAQQQLSQMPTNAMHYYPIANSTSTNEYGYRRMQASGSLQPSHQPGVDQMQMPFDSSANAHDGCYPYSQGQDICNGNEQANSGSLPVQLPVLQQDASCQMQVSFNSSALAQAHSSVHAQGISNEQDTPGNFPALSSSFGNAQVNASDHPLQPPYYLDVQPDPISDAALKRVAASGNAVNEDQRGCTLGRDIERFASQFFQGHEIDSSLSGLSEQALPSFSTGNSVTPGQQQHSAVRHQSLNQQHQTQQQMHQHHPPETLEVRNQPKSTTNTTATSSLDTSSGGDNRETGG